ncbi:DUF2946 family protein [Chitinibacteraceae bacterium HSL-7]
MRRLLRYAPLLALVALMGHLLMPFVHAQQRAGDGALTLAMCSSVGQQVQVVALDTASGTDTKTVVTCPLCAAHTPAMLPEFDLIPPQQAVFQPPKIATRLAYASPLVRFRFPPTQGPPDFLIDL